MKNKINVVHAQNAGTYGSPRVWRELRDEGERVSRKRVARLMKEEGLKGIPKRRFRRTTDSSHGLPVAPNLLNRKFCADAPNRVWASDISYVRTWEGWLYLAVIIDLFSRRVVGWSIADNMRTELVLEALSRAVSLRRPPPGLMNHSDQGSQYASTDYRNALKKHRMVMSMSRKGDCWDNAAVESFFSTLKRELLYPGVWPTKSGARKCIASYIDDYYNTRRRHSSLDYVSPVEYEHGARRHDLAA